MEPAVARRRREAVAGDEAPAVAVAAEQRDVDARRAVAHEHADGVAGREAAAGREGPRDRAPAQAREGRGVGRGAAREATPGLVALRRDAHERLGLAAPRVVVRAPRPLLSLIHI